ncbi:MAG: hypothetical protein JWO54_360 [Candidatus Saccharibacteria bacterium]|nr:hypothetical protein [Candidatus Saccharibacteria bacterium]
MHTTNDSQAWNLYLETTSRRGAPVRIDKILKRRMRTFIRTRQSLVATGGKC